MCGARTRNQSSIEKHPEAPGYMGHGAGGGWQRRGQRAQTSCGPGSARGVGRPPATSWRTGVRAGAHFSPPGKPAERDAPEPGGDSFESSDSLLRSWSSQSSLLEQRVPSFESGEDDGGQALGLGKPTMSFKDYIQERSDPAEQGKPVIPAAVLAGFTGECPPPPSLPPCPAGPCLFIQGGAGLSTWSLHPAFDPGGGGRGAG